MSILVSLCKSLPFCRPHFALVCPWDGLPVDTLPLLNLLHQFLSFCSIVLVRMGQVPAMGFLHTGEKHVRENWNFRRWGRGWGFYAVMLLRRAVPAGGWTALTVQQESELG